jgi:hypothetical protein
MWRLFPELILRADDESDHAKHATFLDRVTEVKGKLLVLNLRRLPSWNLSHAQHEAQGGVFPDYQPLPMPVAEEIAERTFADDMIAYFTNSGQIAIHHWFRQEMLTTDFLDFIAKTTSISAGQFSAIKNLGLVNVHHYDHDIHHWFTDAQVIRMYEVNPVWASIERKIYGFTLDEVVRGRASVAAGDGCRCPIRLQLGNITRTGMIDDGLNTAVTRP